MYWVYICVCGDIARKKRSKCACSRFCFYSVHPIQRVSYRGTDASYNFLYNCYSPVCSDIATVKSAFPPVLWHWSWGVLFPLDVDSPPQIQTQLDWADHSYWQDHGDSCSGCKESGMTPIIMWVPHGSHSRIPASLCSATYLESNPPFLTRPYATNGC